MSAISPVSTTMIHASAATQAKTPARPADSDGDTDGSKAATPASGSPNRALDIHA